MKIDRRRCCRRKVRSLDDDEWRRCSPEIALRTPEGDDDGQETHKKYTRKKDKGDDEIKKKTKLTNTITFIKRRRRPLLP